MPLYSPKKAPNLLFVSIACLSLKVNSQPLNRGLEIRAGNNQLVFRRLAWVTHRPGVDKAELMRTTAAGTQLRDSEVVAVADVDCISRADLCEPKKQDNRFVVDNAIDILEGNAAVPGTQHKGLEREIQTKIHLVEVPLVAILYGWRDTALSIAGINSAADNSGTHIELQAPVKGELCRKRTALVDDRLVWSVEMARRHSQPRRTREEHAAKRNIEESFAEVRVKLLCAGLIDKLTCGRIKLITESQTVKIDIPVVKAKLDTRAKAEILRKL